ncbi:MAG: cytochrome c [Bacteroidota bacterium]
MQKVSFVFIPLVLLCLFAAFQPQDNVLAITADTPVADLLSELGDAPPNHRVNKEVTGVSVEAGRKLVTIGIADKPGGGTTNRQSIHFVCTSCHNIEKEDPDLSKADPVARLTYTRDKGLPFLPGTTLYGVVNRKTFYNGDYEKKYGDLVSPARNDLRGAIALCATECAQGRELMDWEMESILAYFWTIGLNVGDLALSDDEMATVASAVAGKEDKMAAIKLLKAQYLDHSPATFLKPPSDRKAGYRETGDASRGKLVFEQSCLHCHQERRYSFFNLDTSDYTLKFMARHFPRYTRYSSYQVLRYGTSPSAGKRAYMPHYTEERMNNQQVEDLRAYLEER